MNEQNEGDSPWGFEGIAMGSCPKDQVTDEALKRFRISPSLGWPSYPKTSVTYDQWLFIENFFRELIEGDSTEWEALDKARSIIRHLMENGEIGLITENKERSGLVLELLKTNYSHIYSPRSQSDYNLRFPGRKADK